MTDHQFDELFRNRLKDYSSQVPENFWQRIQPEDKDRKGFIFWIWYLIIPVCLLSGVAGAFYYKSSRPVTRNTSSWSSATPGPSSRIITYATISANHSSIPAAVTTPAISVIAPSIPNAGPTGYTYHTDPSMSADNTSNHSNPSVLAAIATPTSPVAPTPSARHRTYSSHTVNHSDPLVSTGSTNPVSPDANINTHTAATSTDRSADPSATRLHNITRSYNTAMPHNTTPAHHPEDHLATAHNQNKNPVSNPGTDSAIFTHSQLPGITPIPHTLHPLTIGKPQRAVANPITKKATPPIPSPKNNFLSSLKKGSWQLDVYASPDMPILQFKNSDQQTQLSFTAGFKINRSFGNNLSGAAGLQYSEVNTKVKYYDSSIYGPRPRTEHLKITSFEFPLLIGYGIGNDRFRATFNTGMIFKIHSTGELHTTSTSLYFGIDLSKKINDKISLFAEPYYRYSLPGGYNSQYFIQRIHHTGLSLGIRYNFTKRQHKTYDVNQ